MTARTAGDVKVALWATNLARPLNGIGAWAAEVDARMAAARAQGAEIFVMPEYASAQWLSFAPDDLPASEEIAWMAAQAPDALAAVADLPARHNMALLPGSWPWRAEAGESDGDVGFVNRAWLLLPDGRRYHQDKLCLTPSEKDPDGWMLNPGGQFQFVEWNGLRLATAICLDVELPALASRIAPYRPDLLLVPSMTERLSGHYRVHSCARARAVELQAAVLAVGVIGDAATGRPRDGNTGGAAVYVPSEPDLGYTGVRDEIAPAAEVEGGGPVLVSDIPVNRIRALREGAAEVWPGAWTADHIEILDETT
ncbi:nitrilase-related carbon-nitrogen hydrolase [Ferruginivarius sediminum]|uniref:Nitrilase n=1 Tax=Ferruginivarius sediminum TaxID=2661937 RepID=A0A369TEW0_9PROT|nr:nitrilase-related carbon-nitrogen hydrolase [Ferruginivarius sediminum]RDD63114.1 nitrilase [Ferruginivarius sediminum]